MKKLVVKLRLLTVLSGLYVAGLSANVEAITPALQACCSGGGSQCCGVHCSIGPNACSATNK